MNSHEMFAELRLLDWATNHARRDELVRAARDAGVSKHRIYILTGIARTTIDRILREEVDSGDPPVKS